MNDYYAILFRKNEKEIVEIANQRKWWLYASSIVFSSTILLIFGWDFITGLNQKSIWWVVVSLMLIICMNWWYWTMKIVHKLLQHQHNEYELIRELLLDIKEARELIIEIKNNSDIDNTTKL